MGYILVVNRNLRMSYYYLYTYRYYSTPRNARCKKLRGIITSWWSPTPTRIFQQPLRQHLVAIFLNEMLTLWVRLFQTKKFTRTGFCEKCWKTEISVLGGESVYSGLLLIDTPWTFNVVMKFNLQRMFVSLLLQDKKTALYWAVEKSNVRIAKILLSANPDIDTPNVVMFSFGFISISMAFRSCMWPACIHQLKTIQYCHRCRTETHLWWERPGAGRRSSCRFCWIRTPRFRLPTRCVVQLTRRSCSTRLIFTWHTEVTWNFPQIEMLTFWVFIGELT